MKSPKMFVIKNPTVRSAIKYYLKSLGLDKIREKLLSKTKSIDIIQSGEEMVAYVLIRREGVIEKSGFGTIYRQDGSFIIFTEKHVDQKHMTTLVNTAVMQLEMVLGKEKLKRLEIYRGGLEKIRLNLELVEMQKATPSPDDIIEKFLATAELSKLQRLVVTNLIEYIEKTKVFPSIPKLLEYMSSKGIDTSRPTVYREFKPLCDEASSASGTEVTLRRILAHLVARFRPQFSYVISEVIVYREKMTVKKAVSKKPLHEEEETREAVPIEETREEAEEIPKIEKIEKIPKHVLEAVIIKDKLYAVTEEKVNFLGKQLLKKRLLPLENPAEKLGKTVNISEEYTVRLVLSNNGIKRIEIWKKIEKSPREAE